MKILFVTGTITGFEISPIIKSQGESLRKIGVQVDFLVIKDKLLRNILKTINNINYKIKTEKYQIVHAHYNVYGWLSSFQNRAKLVVSFMGSDLLGNDKKYFLNVNTIINKRIFRKADYIICKTKQMKSLIPVDKVSVIPNGIDFSKFVPLDMIESREILKLDINKKIILFPANINRREKNFNLAKKSFTLIKNKDIELLCMCKNSAIEHNMVKYFLNASNVVLVTSIYEGSSNIIKEAMACNTPIVTTDVGDSREMLGNINGCYISDFNPENIAKAILNALNFNGKTNAREFIIENLSSDIIAKKIKAIYEHIIN